MTLQICITGISLAAILFCIILMNFALKCPSNSKETSGIVFIMILIEILIIFLANNVTDSGSLWLFLLTSSILAILSLAALFSCRHCFLCKRKKVKEINKLVDNIKSNVNVYNSLNSIK